MVATAERETAASCRQLLRQKLQRRSHPVRRVGRPPKVSKWACRRCRHCSVLACSRPIAAGETEQADSFIPQAESIAGANSVVIANKIGQEAAAEEAGRRHNSWGARAVLFRQILLFTGPALSIPLGDPLMSLIDTICIGQVRSPYTTHCVCPFTTDTKGVVLCSMRLRSSWRRWGRIISYTILPHT